MDAKFGPPSGGLIPIAMLKSNPDGSAVTQMIGPLKSVAPPGTGLVPTRYLVVTKDGSPEAVLLETER
jgi:hypothetical protein